METDPLEEICRSEEAEAAKALIEAQRDALLKTNLKRTFRLEEEARAELQDEQRAAFLVPDSSHSEEFADAILTTDMLDDLPEPVPLVEGFLALSTLARLYGPPKSLKSFIALDIAGCVATGSPWHGNTVTPGRVLYVVAEGVRGIKGRVRAWEEQNGIPMKGVDFYPRAVQIGRLEEMRALVSYAVRHGHLFIIFDTQARCTVGKEENSNTEMGVIVAGLDALKEATGACVLLVHHSGHLGGRARGATAILGALDSEFEVSRKEDVATLKTVAQKDIHEAEEIQFEAVTVPGWSIAMRLERGWADHRLPVTLPEKQAQMLTLIEQYAGATATYLAADTDGNRRNVDRMLKTIMDKGLAEKSGSSWYVTPEGRRALREGARIDPDAPELYG